MRRFIALSILVLVVLALLGLAVLHQYHVTHGPGSIRVVMCPACEQALTAEILAGGDIVCALYDVGNETAAVLASREVAVITDDESNSAYGTPVREYGLMHNKFCVINRSTVVTGSYNPTDGGERNRNNMLIIESEALAENYIKEFSAIRTNMPRHPIHHRLWVGGTKVENYFCPNDGCEDHVLQVLSTAQEEIIFMTYSFTSDEIGNLLLGKKAAGVHVEGLCEPQQVDEHSECGRVGAKIWDGDALLHHKVFIVDRSIVITGSYNPTANADRRNRENILVIYSPEVAQQYMTEYISLQ